MKRFQTALARGVTIALVLATLAAGNGHAADIAVTTFEDILDDFDGTCTLREAVRSANGDVQIDACEPGSGADRILLAAGTYTLNLVDGADEDEAFERDLDLRGPLVIRGASPEYTIIDGVAGESLERVIHVLASTETVRLHGVRITGGADVAGGNILNESNGPANGFGLELIDVVVDGGQAESGGGVHNQGALSLVRTRVEENTAAEFGGGIFTQNGELDVRDSRIGGGNSAPFGGGIAADDSGSVEILRSVIVGNEAEDFGGGLWISFIDDFSALFIRVEGNESAFGGGLFLSNAAGSTPYTVTHSAVIGNTAAARGGGLHVSADFQIRHSTLASNIAQDDGGGGAYTNASALFDAVTIAGNTGGGGIFNESGAFLEASLIAGNTGGNCVGTPPDAGFFNLDDGNTCELPVNEPEPNLVNTDPMLGPLTDNGGPTPTFALQPGSPAIDAINSDSMGQLNCQNDPDQRGYPRGQPPVDVNGQTVFFCDIGAFEVHAPYVVDSTTDEVDDDPDDGICLTAGGTCTLRAAVQQANATAGLEEIELPAGTFAIGLVGADEDAAGTGDFDLLDPVVIRGAGSDETVIDGADLDRVFDLIQPMAASGLQTHFFRDLTIRNGLSPTTGGGLRISGRPVRLERVVLADNDSEGDGGAVYCKSNCELTVVDSRLTGNRSAFFGGGIATDENAEANDEHNPVLVARSELSGNTAAAAGALLAHEVTVRNTTVGDNHAESPDPNLGIGGGVAAFFGVVESSTIVGNTAASDSGGGGVALVMSPTVIAGSLLAGNESGADAEPDNCAFFSLSALSSGGHNLSDTEDADCNLDKPTDLPSTGPLLGPLVDNGGPSRTHALLPGSPAIDAGGDTTCPPTDQRGAARPDDGDGDGTAACDIGAYEAVSANLAVAIGDSPDPVDVGDDVTYTVTVTNNGPGSATEVVVSVTLPAGLDFVSADADAGDCTASAGSVDCELGDLPAGDSVEIRIVATAAQSGEVTVEATVTAAEADGMPADDSASETTTVNASGGGGGSGGGGSGGDGSGGGSSGGGGTADPWVVVLLVLACLAGRRFIRGSFANGPAVPVAALPAARGRSVQMSRSARAARVSRSSRSTPAGAAEAATPSGTEAGERSHRRRWGPLHKRSRHDPRRDDRSQCDEAVGGLFHSTR